MAEDPTRRQQAPNDPSGGGRGEVYEEYEAQAGPSRAELAEQARSSRNWAYGAAFLGLLAAGLAAVALIFASGDDEGEGGRGDAASQSSVTELREDVESLQEQIDEVEGQAEGADDVSQQIEDLGGRVSELESDQQSASEQISQLEERVEQVAEAAEAVSGGTGDGGPDIPNP